TSSTRTAAASAVRVETVPVTRERWQRVSESSYAEILPFEKTDLHAKISGFIKEIRVDIGDHVKKDAVLAILRVPEMEEELKQSEATVKKAEAAVQLVRKAHEAAKASFKTAAARVDVEKAGRQKADALVKRWQIEYDYLRGLVKT